jgi:hypothetical protein
MTTTAKPSVPTVDELMAFENDELDRDAVVDLFQRLINCGLAWRLQGFYSRTAHRLIEAGLCERA